MQDEPPDNPPPGSPATSPFPLPSHRAATRLRAWLREYAWLLTAGGLALLVLLFARVVVSGAAPTWMAGEPVAAVPAAASPTPAAGPTPTRTAPPVARPAIESARGTLRSSPPRTPAPRPAAPPVLLGPGSELALWGMLRDYCEAAHGTSEAQLRSGFSPAENNWECRPRFSPGVLIDMSAACRAAYGAGAFARFTDADSALSWRCYRPA